MLTVPGVSSIALAGCLLQVATLLIMAAGFAFMFGLRRIASRLGALALLLVVATAWSARNQ
jgi:hypothetical protein